MRSASALLWRAADAMGSRALSVGLMAALMLYLVQVLGFAFKAPEPVLAAIGNGTIFKVAYALLALNTLSCVAVFWRTVRSRCRPWHLRPAQPPGPAVALPAALVAARRWLLLRGYSVRALSAHGVHGGRGRFSALGSPLLHLSIVLAALGALLEQQGGFTGNAVVNAGQAFYGEAREYLALSPEQAARAPQLSFKVLSLTPAYFGDELFFTELVARVETPVGPEGRVEAVRLSDSVAMGEGAVTLTGYGYSLDYALHQRGGRTLEEGLATLSIFPPGQKDTLRLPDWPYSFHLELFPDLVVGADGTPRTRGMALGDVRLGVAVVRNRAVLAKQLLRLGERIRFDDLEFEPVRLVAQGQFRVRRSPGVPVLGAAFVLMLLGLALRLLWVRREVVVTLPPGGPLSVQLEGEWPLQAAKDVRLALGADP